MVTNRAPTESRVTNHATTGFRVTNLALIKVQLGPRYEGQLNHIAEPIPHPVRPFVRPHDTHYYLAADSRAEKPRLTLIGLDAACAPF